MKNVLFASTALVAASLATSSFAAERITGSVGGYFMMGLVYQDNGSDPEIGVLEDGEIFLQWRGTSDNGLTFSGRVELEAFTNADQIDEYWARVSGSWGSIKIGSDDSASEDHERGIFYGPGARTGYFDSFYSVLFSSNAGDFASIRYATPNFAGFQASVDWSPNATQDGPTDNAGLAFGTDQQRFSIGASWDGEFNGVNIGIGGGFLQSDVGAGFTTWHLGAQVGYAGFTLGVHFDSAGNGGVEDDGALAVGLQYVTGPWTFGGGWAFSIDGPDRMNWGLWATYALAPGVTATLGYEGNDVAGNFDTTVSAYLRMGF
jgi:outer membrane protein OmpU